MDKNYDSTIMRIAGNLLSSYTLFTTAGYLSESASNGRLVTSAVSLARAIVAEVQRTKEQP